ncbi:MAG: hypothetical protein R3E99_04205 [Burkholderiaceae bacterium]
MTPQKTTAPVDMIIVGAGFAGLYQLYRARRMGLSVRPCQLNAVLAK